MPWSGGRRFLTPRDGLAVVVDLEMRSAMASAEMNRRAPIGTLANYPVRRSPGR